MAIQVRAPAQQLRHQDKLPAASGDAMTVACSMVILAGHCVGAHLGAQTDGIQGSATDSPGK
jgi:hypothetical protein